MSCQYSLMLLTFWQYIIINATITQLKLYFDIFHQNTNKYQFLLTIKYDFNNLNIILFFIQMQLSTTVVQPKRGHQPDKYHGDIHPVSKLRNGKGTYLYDNSFFTYEGDYVLGKKQGKGSLRLKDGRIITGTFQKDQLIGPADIQYPDGSHYAGDLYYGQKQGKGVYKSPYEIYDGEWRGNMKEGAGKLNNLTNGQEYSGNFVKDKPHGKGKINKWNYQYQGQFNEGRKQGQGKQINDWKEGDQETGRFQYFGSFKNDQFQGEGVFRSKENSYVYKGQFHKGRPSVYPNQFKIISNSKGDQGEGVVLAAGTPIEYELEGDSLNFCFQTVYQGPQMLDQIQPTPEQIETMIKNWQNENKKNKNPPPIPDFNQPRMKKPQLVLVTQENGRPIQIRLAKQAEGKEELMKVDYRQEIIAKRKQNEQQKLEMLKKAEQQGNKKGGKKDNKGEQQLKVNLFKQKPTKRQQTLKLTTNQGKAYLQNFELPDDFPQGKYLLIIGSSFKDFGQIKTIHKQLLVKAKLAKKK